MTETVTTFQEDILQHFQALLQNLTIFVDQNGHCFTKKRGSDIRLPVVVEKRKMTLATHEFNSKPDLENFIVFHPFSESIVRGESEIITWLKDRMTKRINALVGVMITGFAELASDGEIQKKLTTDQLSIVQTFGDADQNTVNNVAKLFEKVLASDKESWVHFYLRHSGKTGDKGVQCKRFCKVTFPIYKQLLEEGNKIAGITLRVKDKKFLKAVLEYIFDKIEEEDSYSFGSNSDIAPYYHALINGFAKVAVPVSSRIYTFRKHLGAIADSRIHTEGWLDTFDKAAKQSSLYPNYPFNIGSGGQGTGNENLKAHEGLQKTAVVNDVVNPVEAVNQRLEQMPAQGTLQQLIDNPNLSVIPRQNSLQGLLNQPNAIPFATTSPFAGLPRAGQPAQPNMGVQNNLTSNLTFGGQPVQGLGGVPNQGLQQPSFGQQGFGMQQSSNNLWGGLPRR